MRMASPNKWHSQSNLFRENCSRLRYKVVQQMEPHPAGSSDDLHPRRPREIGLLTGLSLGCARLFINAVDSRHVVVTILRMTICTRPLLWLVTAAVCVRAGNIVGDEPEDTALDACGLPRGYWQTSHCFRDSTHHTCCLLGPEARR